MGHFTEVFIVYVSKDVKEKKKISREYSWKDYSDEKDLKVNMKKLKEWAEPYRYEVEQKLYSFNNMIRRLKINEYKLIDA